MPFSLESIADRHGIAVEALIALADSVARLLAEDGGAGCFIDATDQDRAQLCEAYIAKHVRQVSEVAVSVHMTPEPFVKQVHSLLINRQ